MLSAFHIIPLKMRAHIDNIRLHDEGAHISEKVLRKHRADIVQLAGLLPSNARLPLRDQMRANAEAFLADFEEYASRETNQKKRASLMETFAFLHKVYLHRQ